MNDQDVQTLDQVRAFLKGTEHVEFEVQGKEERYAWTEHTLRRFRYRTLDKTNKGFILRYLQRVSGYSRQQLTRLVYHYFEGVRLKRRQQSPLSLYASLMTRLKAIRQARELQRRREAGTHQTSQFTPRFGGA